MIPAEVTLQINLAPGDWRLARHVLPHQIRAWRNQVSEILLCIDLHRSAGRFAANWEEGRDNIIKLANSIADARVVVIDYAANSHQRVAEEFFGGDKIPAKDFRGGPFYAYFFGLNAAQHNRVLHCDADMMFGGGSATWIAEACHRFDTDPALLVCAPLPGPPAANGRLRHLPATPVAGEHHSHRFADMSTRVFLLDRGRFRTAVGALHAKAPPAWRSRLKAWIERNPNADLPEHLLARAMKTHGLHRVDFLGTAPGMWSLHPPYRCADFFNKLPELIARVESGDMPEAQRGDHDVNESLIDWSEALAALKHNRWWKRLRHNLTAKS